MSTPEPAFAAVEGFNELRDLTMSDEARRLGLVVELATQPFMDGTYLVIVSAGFAAERFRAEPLPIAMGRAEDAIPTALAWIRDGLASGKFVWPPH